MELPPPKDYNLIISLLHRKLAGDLPLCDFIVEADVYAYHPQTLAGDHDADELWFFTRTERHKTGCGLGNRVRRSKFGRWRSKYPSQDIFSTDGTPVGTKQRFRFSEYGSESKTVKKMKKTAWLMEELASKDKNVNDWVICRIYLSRHSKMKDIKKKKKSSAEGVELIQVSDKTLMEETSNHSPDETVNFIGGSFSMMMQLSEWMKSPPWDWQWPCAELLVQPSMEIIDLI